ncbi:MAG: DNA mismatch repair endonuclease MutL, partial [Clostridia bacterium]|nr:DNA mismatch repair endonuclease MutL [Clostridia bacterium]
MGIKLLDKEVINKISAGEVVEKPASIVKELVENSIDAGATSITIEIEDGGISKICVLDNGCGIKKEEVLLAFMPHATSKINRFEDLDSLSTMGFRGEALATISAVSKVTITTKTNQDDTGVMVDIISGAEVARKDIACNTGTKIEVNNVFYNTPARLKFLRKPKSEENDITNYVQKLILSNNQISFKYIVNGKLIYNTISGSTIDNIYTIYGKETAENLLEVNYSIGSYNINGYISKPEFGRTNRTYQNLFVNSRFCSNSLISTAVSNAYEDFAMKGKFPMFVLFVNIPQNELDVNVHPNKLEVKFTDTQKIYKLCNDGVFKALSDASHIKSISNFNNETNNKNVTYTNFFQTTKTEEQEFGSSEKYSNFFKENDGSMNFELSNNLISSKEAREIISKRENDLRVNNDNNSLNNQGVSFNLQNDSFVSDNLQEVKLSEIELSLPQKQVSVQTSYESIFELSYTVIGKLFNTYLLLEQENKLYIIDQHAAHERQKYDALISEIENNSIKTQGLLIPYTFKVSPGEYNFISENLASLISFGIDITEFGIDTFKISALPLLLADLNLSLFIKELLANVNGLVKSPKEIIKEKLMQMACKSAVRGGDDLKDLEIKALLNKLKDETKVLLCPHGRPFIVEIDKKQIEKWFKR